VAQALILRRQEQMGMAFQRYQADVSEALSQGATDGIQITSGEVAEDYRVRDELLLLFPAGPINGLDGYFGLTLSVDPAGPTKPGTLVARQAQMVQEGGEYTVLIELKADGPIQQRWTYTRHPGLRQVYTAMFDDPDLVVEGEIFHQAPFSVQPTGLPMGTAQGWTSAAFTLDPYLIEQSRRFDYAEQLLEAMDDAFTAGTGEYLQWAAPLVTAEGIEAVAADLEERLRQAGEPVAFHFTISTAQGEIARGKRLQPLLRHTLTLIGEDGTARPGTVGISVSGQ